MLIQTPYSIPTALIHQVHHDDLSLGKTVINAPTGRFFYDPWTIKSEYAGTVWDTILKTLPVPVGEARIIVLNYGSCYQQHADIDDRYHLNLSGESCYLVDIDSKILYPVTADGIWYTMNTERIHSATNFGRYNRVQLVVRHLLIDADFDDGVAVRISFDDLDPNYARYIFDNSISVWLNRTNKQHGLKNFEFSRSSVTFSTRPSLLASLKDIVPKEFILTLI